MEILNADGQLISHLKAGTEIVIRIHYAVREALLAPRFGFGLLTEKGARVLNSVSNDSGPEIARIEGSGFVEVHIRDVTLAIGRYLCNLAVTDRTGNYCDYLRDVPLFEITQGGKLPVSRTYDQSSGIVYPEIMWELKGDL